MKIWKESSCCQVASSSNMARKMICGGLEVRPRRIFRRKEPSEEAASPLRKVKSVVGSEEKREEESDKKEECRIQEWERCGRVCSSQALSLATSDFLLSLTLRHLHV